MILKTSLTVVVAAALLAPAPLAQQSSIPSQPQTASKAAAVSLIGCVERVTPAQPARGTAQPTPQASAYKLIDVQPGTGTSANLKPGSEFLLTVATSLATPIDFGKFQNQWVEVTGTISPAPPPQVNPPGSTRPAGGASPAPLATLTTTALKVVSTECK